MAFCVTKACDPTLFSPRNTLQGCGVLTWPTYCMTSTALLVPRAGFILYSAFRLEPCLACHQKSIESHVLDEFPE